MQGQGKWFPKKEEGQREKSRNRVFLNVKSTHKETKQQTGNSDHTLEWERFFNLDRNMSDLSYQQFYAARLVNAMEMARANRVDHCPATKLANEFLDDENNWHSLPTRLQKLASFVGNDGNDETQRLVTATVFVRAPESFYDDFEQLFESLLNAHQKKWAANNAEDSMEVDDEDLPNEDDERLLSEEISLYASLNTLGWIKKKLHRPFRSALNKVTIRVISEIAANNWEEEGVYQRAMEWKSSVLEPWVTSVVGASAFAERRYDAQLEYSCSEAFIMVRMGELFELVTEWPESLPAVKELSVALDRTGRLWYQSLAKQWRNSLRARLLHPGAETSQIIDVYINIIKVLREMDPSGELLEVVSQPVREYLKGREDTIRCIVTSLTDEENGGELYEELKRQDAKPLDDAQLLDEEDDEEQPSFDWMPPPSILNRRGVISGQVGLSCFPSLQLQYVHSNVQDWNCYFCFTPVGRHTEYARRNLRLKGPIRERVSKHACR